MYSFILEPKISIFPRMKCFNHNILKILAIIFLFTFLFKCQNKTTDDSGSIINNSVAGQISYNDIISEEESFLESNLELDNESGNSSNEETIIIPKDKSKKFKIKTCKKNEIRIKDTSSNISYECTNITCASWGGKDYMEDRSVYAISRNKDKILYGVYDGHGGHRVSCHVKENLHDIIFEAIESVKHTGNIKKDRKKITEKIISAYRNFDESICNEDFNSGSTAVVVILYKDTLIFSNLGDSRAILLEDENLVHWTKDHKPINEKERIKKSAGGYLNNGSGTWRVNSSYFSNPEEAKINGSGWAVSRSLGDKNVKLIKNGNDYEYNRINPPMSAVPKITFYNLKKNHEYTLIMGTDGLWDEQENNTVTSIFKQNNKKSIKFISQLLTKKAFHLNGPKSDNITTTISKIRAYKEKTT